MTSPSRRFPPTLTTMLMLASLALVVIAAACGVTDRGASTGPGATGPGATAAPPSAPPGPTLEGRTFVSRTVTEGGAPRALVAGTKLSLAFRDGRLSAGAGCNTMGTTYTMAGPQIILGSELTMTAMACGDPALNAQEAWFSTHLQATPTITLAGDTVTFTSDDTVIELVDQQVTDPARPLVGTHWVADTIFAGAGPEGTAASMPAGVTPPTLDLAADATVRFTTGCSTGSGRYAVVGDQLTFLAMALDPTPNPCPQAGSHEVEQQVLPVLDGTMTVTIDGPSLQLRKPDRGLGFRAG